MKISIVDIKGGLGNQIFQLAYAIDLRNKNHYVFLDVKFYDLDNRFPRDLIINPKNFGFNSIKFKNNRLFYLLNTFFQEDDTYADDNFRTFNRFVGYYQNLEYVTKYSEFIKTNLFNDFKKLDSNLDSEIVALHIRRSDYLEINQVLDDDYYLKSIEIISKKIPNFKLDIFCDEPIENLNPKISKYVNNIYVPIKNENPLEVLIKMSRYKNYIIANSSYSALAAVFSNSKNKIVIYPKPWFRESNISLKNIPDDWIAVYNK